jgi:hypothetical protein
MSGTLFQKMTQYAEYLIFNISCFFSWSQKSLFQALVILYKTVWQLVTFMILMAVGMKMTVFWVVAPCSLVEVYRHFRGAYSLHHQGNEPQAPLKCQ